MIRTFLSFAAAASLATVGATTGIRDDYQIWCVGNCDHDITPSSTTPGAVLMGGGVCRPFKFNPDSSVD